MRALVVVFVSSLTFLGSPVADAAAEICAEPSEVTIAGTPGMTASGTRAGSVGRKVTLDYPAHAPSRSSLRRCGAGALDAVSARRERLDARREGMTEEVPRCRQ